MKTKKVGISGGSGGLGLAITRKFLADNYEVVWIGNNEAELIQGKEMLLKAFQGASIDYFVADLTNANDFERLHAWLAEHHQDITVFINNAGFTTFGYVNEISEKWEENMIALNILATYKLTRVFLQWMMERNDGTIINISSNSSFQPSPRITTYAATKAFVTSFSRGLQEELKMQGSNVLVMTVCPAAIQDTAFKNKAKMDKVKTFNGIAFTTAKEVADDLWNGFLKKRDFVVSGWKMRILYRIKWLVPYRIQLWMVKNETKETI